MLAAVPAGIIGFILAIIPASISAIYAAFRAFLAFYKKTAEFIPDRAASNFQDLVAKGEE